MSAKTVTKSDRLNWLMEHPDLWEGYPKQFALPLAKSHYKRIFEAMKKAGLFAPTTQCCGLTIDKLIDQARFVRRMSQQKPKPENN